MNFKKINFKEEQTIPADELDKVILKALKNQIEIHFKSGRIIIAFGIMNALGFIDGEVDEE